MGAEKAEHGGSGNGRHRLPPGTNASTDAPAPREECRGVVFSGVLPSRGDVGVGRSSPGVVWAPPPVASRMRAVQGSAHREGAPPCRSGRAPAAASPPWPPSRPCPSRRRRPSARRRLARRGAGDRRPRPFGQGAQAPDPLPPPARREDLRARARQGDARRGRRRLRDRHVGPRGQRRLGAGLGYATRPAAGAMPARGCPPTGSTSSSWARPTVHVRLHGLRALRERLAYSAEYTPIGEGADIRGGAFCR